MDVIPDGIFVNDRITFPDSESIIIKRAKESATNNFLSTLNDE